MYRTFAIGTLLAAPLIVMAVQNFVPKNAPSDRPGATEQVNAPPPPGIPMPPPLPVAPPVAPAYSAPNDAATPVSGAGEPMLRTSGPDTPPPGAMPAPANPLDAPPGSPNDEL